MAVIETIEGVVGTVWYHYDVADDVLYLRLRSRRDTATVGEETDDGFILLRDEKTNQPVGLTVVNWWKRFGVGELPDSIREIQRHIEPLGERIGA
jgi:hypothetical protein